MSSYNTWPPQNWSVNPNGPGAYEDGNPYDKFFGYLGISFPSQHVEHFEGSDYKTYAAVGDMLRILIFVLGFLFIIQLLDLMMNS